MHELLQFDQSAAVGSPENSFVPTNPGVYAVLRIATASWEAIREWGMTTGRMQTASTIWCACFC